MSLTTRILVALVAGLAAQQMANEPTGNRWRSLSGDAMKMLTGYVLPDQRGTS